MASTSSPNPTIGQSDQNSQSELQSLEQPTNSGYTINKYPEDLGTAEDNLHYVVFYINLPSSSKYLKGNIMDAKSNSQKNFDYTSQNGGVENNAITGTQTFAASVAGAVTGGAKAIPGSMAKGKSGKGRAARILAGAVGGAAKTGVGGLVASSTIELYPKLNRINECIALYMPDDITTSYDHGYQTVSVTAAIDKIAGQAAIAAGAKDVITGDVSIGAAGAKAEAAVAAATAAGVAGPGFKELAMKSAGVAINPQNELVFSGTDFRKFSFNFKFQARTQSEAQKIQDIIRTFRRYAAPELLENSQNGRYFVPPAQFDIKFYFMNKENPNIFKVSTCVLTNVNPNYAGSGEFLTFTDGQPIDISLRLSFTETDIIYRDLIDKFGY